MIAPSQLITDGSLFSKSVSILSAKIRGAPSFASSVARKYKLFASPFEIILRIVS